MKNKEVREKSANELKKDLVELRNKLTKLRFDISAKQVKNHREIRKTKKEIARILTVLGQSSDGQAILKKRLS